MVEEDREDPVEEELANHDKDNQGGQRLVENTVRIRDEELEAPPKNGIELGVEAADAHLREVPVGVDDLGPLHLTNILLVSCRYRQYLQYVLCLYSDPGDSTDFRTYCINYRDAAT